MTSPVVGSARIEVLGDTAAMAASMDAELKASAAKLATEFGRVFGPAVETEMAASGVKSGEVFYKGIDGKLRTAQGRFVSAGRAAAAGYTDAVIAEMEVGTPKVAEAGAVQGRAASKGFAEQGAKGGKGFIGKITEALMGGKALTVAAVVAVGVEAAKMAGDFQTGMVRLVTAAGETKGNLNMVSQGVLDISRSTGVSAHQLADGMYMVESAGFHGKKGLEVMKAAAEGAKVDMADANVVANALTTVLTDMGKHAGSPVEMMSKLVATVGHGKMTMDDLAGSIHSVLPNASAIGLSFGQVAGALATMTAQGIGAAQGAQNLNHAILSLANPTAVQTKTMAAFGLNAVDVASHLGKRGLTGTLELLEQAVIHKMGPAGTTILNVMNTSTIASDKAKRMLETLPKSFQQVATGFMKGTTTSKDYHAALAKLSGQQQDLAGQWHVSAKRAEGFNDLLKSGSPDALTFAGAMAKMTGGQVGLQVALHLTGENMATYKANVKGIDEAHAEAGGHVEGWAIKQKTFNQVMSQLTATVKAAMIEVGLHLLPVLTDLGNIILNDVFPAISSIVGKLGDLYHLIRDHQSLMVLVSMIGGAAAAFYLWKAAIGAWELATKLATKVQLAFNAATDANPVMLIVMAIAALTAGVIYAYFHFKPFHDIVDAIGRTMRTVFVDAFNIAKKVVGEVVGFIMDHWKWFAAGLIIAMGPIAVAIALVTGVIYELVTHFSDLKDAAERVWHDVTRWFHRMQVDIAVAILEIKFRILEVWNRIRDDVTGAVTAVWHAIRDAWNKVLSVTSGILDSVGEYIHKHWRLMLIIVTGGAGLIWVVIQDHWHQIMGVFNRLYNDVAGVVTKLWHAVVGVWNRVYGDVAAVVSRIWHDVAGFFTRIYNDVAGAVTSLWHKMVSLWNTIYNAIADPVKRIWKDVTGFFTRIFNDVTSALTTFWHNEVTNWTRIYNDVAAVVSRLWKDVTGFFHRIYDDVTGVVSSIWRKVTDQWDTIYTSVTGTASKIWHGVTGFFGHLRDDVTKIFDQAVSAVGKAWDKIKEIVAVPIRWVVDNVYDKGILPLFHAVGGVLHESSMQNMKEFHFAKGGVVPGSRAQGDNVPIYATAGEVVVPTPTVGAFGGPQRLMELLGMTQRTGGPGDHFIWGGGVVGGAVNKAKSAASAVAGAVTGAVSDLAHLARGMLAAGAGPIIHGLESAADSHLGTTGMGGIMDRAVHTIGDKALAWLKGSDSKAAAAGGAGGGPIPTGAHLALINQALGYAGVPVTPANEASVDLIVRMESGWNPNAINLTDSNAQAGHPSQGLMQTIPSTFSAYALPGLGGITTPIANLVAGIRYAMANYGSLQNVPGVRGVNSGTGYVGYDNGGPLMPGLTHVWNGTGRVENVTTGEHGDAMENKSDRMIELLEAIAAKDLTLDGQRITRRVNDVNAYQDARAR